MVVAIVQNCITVSFEDKRERFDCQSALLQRDIVVPQIHMVGINGDGIGSWHRECSSGGANDRLTFIRQSILQILFTIIQCIVSNSVLPCRRIAFSILASNSIRGNGTRCLGNLECSVCNIHDIVIHSRVRAGHRPVFE